MGVLSGLEPRKVFEYFEAIAAIPHGSRNTKAISDYLVAEAARLGLESYQDSLNNVIIYKPASAGYEQAATVVLQGHMDMVCEKTDGCETDFTKDGLKLVCENGYVSAEGTTLGGDDGIAVAYMLAILADRELPHPALECVFTVDEEIGMDGAQGLDGSKLSGRILMNMDSEGEGTFLAGCAGGATASVRIPLEYETKSGTLYTLALGGLRGGHSGVEIHKGRANADVMMGRLLDALLSKQLVSLVSIEGGSKDNAIPRSCKAKVLVKDADAEQVAILVKAAERTFKNEYQAIDPEINIVFAEGEDAEAKAETVSLVTRNKLVRRRFLIPPREMKKFDRDEAECLTLASAGRLVTALVGLPNGVQAMDSFIPGLVETSLNLGILKIENGAAVLGFSVRSSVNSKKDALLRRLQLLAAAVGATMTVEGAYPAWQYRADSALRDLMVGTYTEMFGTAPTVETIHAGVECGLLSDKLPGMDAVSFGPNIYAIHTPDERMEVASVERTFRFILEVLKRMK